MVNPLIFENDTSELFLRAYKLMSLDKGKEINKNITFYIDNKSRNSSIKREVNGMKNSVCSRLI